MAGYGSGAPLVFGCAKCKLHWNALDSKSRGRDDRVVLTGRTKKNPALGRGNMQPRTSRLSYQYRCLDCDHEGWSNHIELADKAMQESMQTQAETTPTSTTTLTTEIPLSVALYQLIGAFDSSAIRYWLRTAYGPDDEGDGGEAERAKPRLRGEDGEHDGDNCEIHWPEGFDADSFDGSVIPWLPEKERPWNARSLYFAPLVEGGSIVLYVDPEDSPGGVDHVVLDLPAIRRGFQVMFEKYPRHFADMVGDQDDATTHDVFVQCCVFGEIHYC